MPATALQIAPESAGDKRLRPRLASFADMAMAVRRQANSLADRTNAAEIDGYRIGLPAVSIEIALRETRNDAQLLAEAYRLLTALLPVETMVRRLADKSC